VAAFVMTVRKDTRQGAEQVLARELIQQGVQGVPGYTVVAPEAQKDREAAKRILADAGITGAVLMQVVGANQETVATAGQAYYLGPNVSTFSGFWNYGWGMAYAPGTVNNKTTLMVETLIYSVDQDKLLWAGTSKRTYPKNVGEINKTGWGGRQRGQEGRPCKPVVRTNGKGTVASVPSPTSAEGTLVTVTHCSTLTALPNKINENITSF
jgi:hypothetical protein